MATHLNIEEVFGEHGWTMVDRLTLTVELATKHLCGDGHLEDVARKLAMRVRVVNVSRAFKDLIQPQSKCKEVNSSMRQQIISTRTFKYKRPLNIIIRSRAAVDGVDEESLSELN